MLNHPWMKVCTSAFTLFSWAPRQKRGSASCNFGLSVTTGWWCLVRHKINIFGRILHVLFPNLSRSSSVQCRKLELLALKILLNQRTFYDTLQLICGGDCSWSLPFAAAKFVFKWASSISPCCASPSRGKLAACAVYFYCQRNHTHRAESMCKTQKV